MVNTGNRTGLVYTVTHPYIATPYAANGVGNFTNGSLHMEYPYVGANNKIKYHTATGIWNSLSGDRIDSNPLLISVGIVDNVNNDVNPIINTILIKI